MIGWQEPLLIDTRKMTNPKSYNYSLTIVTTYYEILSVALSSINHWSPMKLNFRNFDCLNKPESELLHESVLVARHHHGVPVPPDTGLRVSIHNTRYHSLLPQPSMYPGLVHLYLRLIYKRKIRSLLWCLINGSIWDCPRETIRLKILRSVIKALKKVAHHHNQLIYHTSQRKLYD